MSVVIVIAVTVTSYLFNLPERMQNSEKQSDTLQQDPAADTHDGAEAISRQNQVITTQGAYLLLQFDLGGCFLCRQSITAVQSL